MFVRAAIGTIGLLLGAAVTFAQTGSSFDEPVWDLGNVEQRGQFTFYDAPAGASQTGKPLEAGDFDGDGCGDLAVAASNASFRINDSSRRSAGHVRIVMNLCEISGIIDMQAEPPHRNQVITIWGAQSGDMAGTEVFVSDFNGDGYDDLLVGAQNNDGINQDRRDAGAAYMILGGEEFAQVDEIDLSCPPANVISLFGASAQDRFGLWVDGGDFDGDGFADLLIGANQADGEDDSRINAGEAWIIFGGENLNTLYGRTIDMAAPPASAARLIGVDYDDLFSSTALGADVDQDGYDDAIVSSALWRESAGIGGLELGGGDGMDDRRYNSGEMFVVYGHRRLRGTTIDLA